MGNLTAGITEEFSPSISREGLVVFSGETRYTNLYMLPLDVNRGQALGPPKLLTRDLGQNIARSVSADGSRVVFLTRRPADSPSQVWLRDLAAAEEHALTAGGMDKSAPEINPAGTLVAWRESSIKIRDIFRTPEFYVQVFCQRDRI